MDKDRVLKLRATSIVLRRHRPSVLPREHLRTAFHEHRLDGEHLVYTSTPHGTRTAHHLASVIVREVENVRQHVHVTSNAVTRVILDHVEPVLLRLGLDRTTNLPVVHARLANGDSSVHGALRRLHELLSLLVNVAAQKGPAGVSVPS